MGSGKNSVAFQTEQHLEVSPFILAFGDAVVEEVEVASQLLTRRDRQRVIASTFGLAEADAPRAVDGLERLLDGRPAMASRRRELREAYQWWGDFRRRRDPDIWVAQGIRSCVSVLASGLPVSIPDVRLVVEADALVAIGVQLIRLDLPVEHRLERLRRRDGHGASTRVLAHQTETDLDDYENFALRVRNGGSVEAVGHAVASYLVAEVGIRPVVTQPAPPDA